MQQAGLGFGGQAKAATFVRQFQLESDDIVCVHRGLECHTHWMALPRQLADITKTWMLHAVKPKVSFVQVPKTVLVSAVRVGEQQPTHGFTGNDSSGMHEII